MTQPTLDLDALQAACNNEDDCSAFELACTQPVILALIDRLRKAEAAREGWKLVPIEPTTDMVTDGFESWPDPFFSKPEDWDEYEAMTGCQKAAHRARLCYRAMLAAAPDSTPTDSADSEGAKG